MAGDRSDRPQLQGGCRGGDERANVLGDGFGDWVGTGLREMVYQQGGVVSEGIEFNDGEVSFCEGAGFVEEDCRCVPSIWNRLCRLVTTEDRAEVNKAVGNEELCTHTLISIPFFAATDTAMITTIGTHSNIAHWQLTTRTVIIFINAFIPAFSTVLPCMNFPTNIQIRNVASPSTNTTGVK